MGVKEVIEAWSDRVRDPFIGKFTIIFLTINWQIVVIFFSGDSSTQKIASIEKILDPSSSTFKVYLLPLVLTFAYSLVWPLFRNAFLYVDRWFETQIHNWRQNADLNRKENLQRLNDLQTQVNNSRHVAKNVGNDLNAQYSFFLESLDILKLDTCIDRKCFDELSVLKTNFETVCTRLIADLRAL